MKMIDTLLRSNFFQANLKTKLTLTFILPMIFAIAAISFLHLSREWTEVQELTREAAVNAGHLILGSMRHAMFANDGEMISDIIGSLEKQPNIERVWLIDNMGLVTDSQHRAKSVFQSQAGCIECHLYAPEDRSKSVYLPGTEALTLRVIIPVENEVECQGCHLETESHLGVLLIDYQMKDSRAHMIEDVWINIGITGIMVFIILALSYVLIHWLIELRIGVIDESLSAYAAGDFSVRIPVEWRTQDEITSLASTFNEMAASLEQHQKEQQEVANVRQRAIIDERERLSRDLHDGIVQVLGYLATKLSAIKLFIAQGQVEKADQQLDDMEKIVSRENAEVRAAIAGLQTINLDEATLIESLRSLVDHNQQLCEIEISQTFDPAAEKVRLNPEVEFHLGRIVQEAISNARKHAEASRIEVSVDVDEGQLIIAIKDDGAGFNPWLRSNWQYPHLGLNSMSDRSEKIDAAFSVHSEQGQGTRITVKVDLDE